MHFKKSLIILPIIAFAVLGSACGNPNPSDPSDPELPNVDVPIYEYNENWVQGANALEGAIQPSLKNPIGEFTTINKMRRTQNAHGLPSKGNANILVVPLHFEGDTELEGQYKDLYVFDDNEVAEINKLYFGEKDENSKALPSVSEYYKISSYGKLNLSGVVTPVITYKNSYVEVIEKLMQSSKVDVYEDIVNYVVDYLFNETETYYIGDFDSDKDGKIDAISFILNYPFAEVFGSGTTQSQAHLDLASTNNVYFAKDIKNIEDTNVNSYSFISYSFMNYDEDEVYDSNVFVANVGRMIGLELYEDLVQNPTTGHYRNTFGYTDMMEGYVGDHNAFSKYQLGWIEPQIISTNSIPEGGLEVTIKDLTSSGEAILLHVGGKHSMFSEYLLIDMYYPQTELNKANHSNTGYPGLFSTNTLSSRGVRVTKVDARLVRGYANNFIEYNDEPTFNEFATLPNGDSIRYTYDYAYTNQSVNKYSSCGITENYPLAAYLSVNGSNRHLTSLNYVFSSADLFKVGDCFGSDDQVEGFYKDFAFNGNGVNGPKLNINFKVEEFINNKATLKFWREN